jgi:prepilin-type N-terminal cleavage/methylation domain-containing protein
MSMRQDRHASDIGQPAQAGFTLVEVMIALGIMVIGFSMLATSFPVAIVENRESVNKTMSAMICQNAVGVVRSRFSHKAGVNGAPTLNGVVSVLMEKTGDIGPMDRIFPVPDLNEQTDWLDAGRTQTASRYAYVVAIRQVVPDVNYYQVAVVACRKFNAGDTLRLDDCSVSGNKAVGGVSIGSPVILKNSGEWATVYNSNGNLDRPLPDCAAGGAYCVKNYSGGDSPAIGCMVTMLAVKP